MFLTLVLLFTLLPIVEISLLITLGQSIGWPMTLLIALGTGVLGAALARAQGLATLARLSSNLASGNAPADALVDGAMILFAGAVLLTPGVLTDAAGFALLLPPVRAVLKPWLRATLARRLQRGVQSGSVRFWSFGPGAGPPPRRQEPDVIDAEVIDTRSRDAEP